MTTSVSAKVKERPYLYAFGALGVIGAGYLIAKAIANSRALSEDSSLSASDDSVAKPSAKGWFSSEDKASSVTPSDSSVTDGEPASALH